jgi:hypothetical protein
VGTWTEQMAAIRPRAVLTQRAGAEACRRVGKDAHAVAAVARDLGVGWATIMRAVHEHGSPLAEDPARLQPVTALGLDETSFLKATRTAPTRWVTGLVDLEGGRLLDVVADRTRAAVHGWLDARSREWLAQITTVALDPWRGYASALVAPLGHATVVVDPLPRHPAGQRGGRPGPPPDPAGHPGASGPQARPAVPHPQAAADRGRAAHRPGTDAATGRPGRRRSDRRGGGRLAGQGAVAGRLRRGRSSGGACRLEPLLPLVGRRSGRGAVTAGAHGAGVGGRDPCLACHRRVLPTDPPKR